MTAFLIGLSAGLILAHFAVPYLLDWWSAATYRRELRRTHDAVVARIVRVWGWDESRARAWAEHHYSCPDRQLW